MSGVGRLNGDLLDSCAASFAGTYVEARAKFRAAAGDPRAYPSAARGPTGEALSTEVAWRGSPEAARVCVVISGVHGAEGYCGSGIQVDWLTRGGPEHLPPDCAVLLIHAINPYGFAWDRRVTQEGCDLNRNFVDFESGVPHNPDYDALAEALVPPALSGPLFEAAERRIAQYRAEHGELAFQRARKSGQYRHPAGMFFGGFGPTAARLTLERIAADFGLAERDFVTVIDLHTGLGPFGYGEAQSEHPPESRSHALACRIFGQSVTSPDLGTSFSVPLNGTLLSFWDGLRGDGRHVYLCLEFGTYDPEAGRRALRLDHWFHAHGGGDPGSELGRQVRAAVRRHYYPGTVDWQEMVLFRGRQVLRQALEARADLEAA